MAAVAPPFPLHSRAASPPRSGPIRHLSIGPAQARRWMLRRLFHFCIFQKKILQKYILGFRFYSSILLPPGRGGGRDLYVNKNKYFLRRGPWREPAAPLPPHQLAAGGLPPGRGAAGSHHKYKTPPLPSAPSFCAHGIQRGERERGGVREVIPPREALLDFGSEPQVTNISQLSY